MRHALLAMAVVLVITAAAALQPLEANAQSTQSTALEDVTVEQVQRLRDQVLKKRAAAIEARGAAFDQRSKTDTERALRPDTDLFFEEGARDKARRLREACAAKDWHACTELGQMYEQAEGTWIDEHLAFAFYVTACFGRDTAACLEVSWNWRLDAATGRYEGQAPYADAIAQACDNGHAESCNRVSVALKHGDGAFARDEARADDMLARACQLGFVTACSQLPKTPAEEVARDALGCASGKPFHCFLLGRRLITGNGLEMDVTRGETLIRESCDQGEVLACAWVIKEDALDTTAQADLLARGCVVRPGRICNDAARLSASLPVTAENTARLDQMHELGCGAPQAHCFHRFWVQVEWAASHLDPFDPAADIEFSDTFQPMAARLREECSAGIHDACQQLARVYARDASPQRRLLAAKVLQPSCSDGDGAACLSIAELRSVTTRARQALYQQACEAGMREGCLRLVVTDAERTPAERLAPVQDACSYGDVIACRMQAELLADEAGRFDSARTDRVRAQALFLFACESDDIEACYRHGRALAEQARRGTAEDGLMDKASIFLDRACLADHAGACFLLGAEYETDLSPKDTQRLSQSILYFGRACALDHRSCEDQARVTLLKDRNALRAEHGVLESALMAHEADFKEDYWARVRRYRRDCQAGDMDQCVNLGERYVDDLEIDGIYGLPASTPSDWAWARALFDLACDAGNARGCEAFADSFHGSGPRSEPKVAIAYSRKGCALGAAEGCYRLAEFYLDGEHVARDLAVADRYFRQACDLGMDYACERLADRDLSATNRASRHDRLTLACVHGSWYACGRLRDHLSEMGASRRNRGLRQEFANIACDEGDEDMCSALGRTPSD